MPDPTEQESNLIDQLINLNSPDSRVVQNFITTCGHEVDLNRMQEYCFAEQYSFHPDDPDAGKYCVLASNLRHIIRGGPNSAFREGDEEKIRELLVLETNIKED